MSKRIRYTSEFKRAVAQVKERGYSVKAKYFAGAVAILLSLWVIIGEQITGASSNAVVNARLTTMRAPISGHADIRFDNIGREFYAGEVTAVIENPFVDTSLLHELQREGSNLLAEIVSQNEFLKITNTEIADAQSRLDNYIDLSIVKNKHNIARSEERIRLFDKIESAIVISKEGKLSIRSVQNSIELSRANENLEIQQEIRRSLLKKTFIGEGLMELHQLQGYLIERNVYRSNASVRLKLSETKLLHLEKRIIQETVRLDFLKKTSVTTKGHGLLWEKLIADGEMVKAGQELFKLVVCNSSIVTLSVSQNVYNTLAVGQNAQFFPDNSDLKFEGKIARLAGARASKIYRGLAIPPSRNDEDKNDVLLMVPELRNEARANCAIGRTGRVFFERRPLDWLRNLKN
jgi:hypothetical protein